MRQRGFMLRTAGVVGAVIGLLGTALAGGASPAAAAVGPVTVEQVNAFSAYDSTVYKSVRATCPAGKQVIGTAYNLIGAEGAVVLDDLIPDRTSVLVGAGEVSGPGEPADGTTASWQIEATALCVPSTSMTLQIVSRTSDFRVTGLHESQSATASCPPGTKALGMGQALSNGFGQVAPGELNPGSGSVKDGIPSFGWVTAYAEADLDGYSGAWSITAYAICGPELTGLSRAQSPFVPVDSRSPRTGTAVCAAGRAALSAGFTLGFGFTLSMAEVLISKAEVGRQSGAVAGGSAGTAVERTPGTDRSWDYSATTICADGTNAPIVPPFSLTGLWNAGFGSAQAVTITETGGGLLAVNMSAFGRPTGRGGINDNTHITVSFPDDRTYIGTLVAPGRIAWSNGSTWTRL